MGTTWALVPGAGGLVVAAVAFVVGRQRYRRFASGNAGPNPSAGGGGQPLMLAAAVVVLGLAGAGFVAELHANHPG
jgi:hypothetical protein